MTSPEPYRRPSAHLVAAVVGPSDPWQGRGICRDVNPETFYGDDETAKEICRRCPRAEACLKWALETGEEWGVYGATTPDERKAMLTKAGAA